MKGVIIAHGSLTNYTVLKEECDNSDVIICADGGAEFAYNHGVIPDYLIGDFDSIDGDLLRYFENKRTEIVKFPVEKDFTDTEICVYKAIDLGCSEICILAGIGGRIDHTLGNIGLLYTIYKKGAYGYIAADDCSIYLCSREINIRGKISDIVSVIPFNGDASGVNLKGLKYPLNNAYIEFGKPIGISNEMMLEECHISLEKGILLVIKNNS